MACYHEMLTGVTSGGISLIIGCKKKMTKQCQYREIVFPQANKTSSHTNQSSIFGKTPTQLAFKEKLI